MPVVLAVGHLSPPRDDEETLSPVRGSDVGSTEIEPDRIVPRFGKVSENGSQSARSERCDVLHDDDAGSKLASDARELEPQTAALTCEASALPCVRHVLAGEPTAEDVDGGRISGDGSHVVESKSVGPVSREDAAAPRIGLALPRRLTVESSIAQRAFNPEVKAADAAEERADAEHHRTPARRASITARRSA